MKSRSNLILLTLCFFWISIFSYFLFRKQASNDVGSYLVLNGAVSCFFFATIAGLDLITRKNISVIQIYCFGSFLRIAMGGMYAGVIINQNYDYMLMVSDHLPIRYMPHALMLMEIGAASFIFGALATESKNKISSKDYFHFPSESSIFLFAIIGWACYFFEVAYETSFGVLGTVLRTLPRTAIFLYSLLAFFRTARIYIYYALIAIILFIEFYLSRSSAMRERFAFILLPITLAYVMEFCRRWRTAKKPYSHPSGHGSFLPKKRKLLIYFTIVIILFFNLLVIYPAGTLVKKNKTETIDTAIVKVVQVSLVDMGAIHKFPDQGIFSLAHRLSLIVVSPAIILELMNQSVRIEHDPIQIVLAGFIPRIMWQGKPIISKGGWFQELISPFANRDSGTSIAMTATGELYWAYGYLGVLIGMFVLGGYCNLLWHQLEFKQLRNPFIIVAVIHITQECIRSFEGEFSSPLSLLLLLGLMSLLYNKLFITKSSHSLRA